MNLIACTGLDRDRETFGAVLQRRRLEKGWTVAQLCRAALVNSHPVYRWEADLCEPTWPQRLALREALGVSPDDDGGWWQPW